MDILSRKNKRSRGGAGSDSDSDDGPPPDPDEIAPAAPVVKKEKKASGETREVQVSTRKGDVGGGMQATQGALSAVRRDMLSAIRTEEDEAWQDLEYYDVTVCSLRSFTRILYLDVLFIRLLNLKIPLRACSHKMKIC